MNWQPQQSLPGNICFWIWYWYHAASAVLAHDVFEIIIKESMSISTVGFSMSTGATQDCGLTFEEESTVHYVGRYVIKWIRPMSKCSPCWNSSHSYSENSPADDDPMQHWVNPVNSGGLTRITQEAFGAFTTLKSQLDVFSRWIIQGTWMNNSVLNDEDLLFDWCLASQFAGVVVICPAFCWYNCTIKSQLIFCQAH